MNKTAIRNFAIWSRKKMMDDVRMRAELIGITEEGISDPLSQSTNGLQYFDVGTADPHSISGSDIFKRDRIVGRLQNRPHGQDYGTAYRNLLEHTASTWFNRLAAIRFMEVNDYFDDGLRILSSLEEGKQDSDLMSSPFDSNLEFSENERQQIIDWKLNNDSEELFRTLLLKKCGKLSEILPGLFNTDDDPTELLMNFSITDKNGFIWHLTHDVDEEDWKEQVQIIGWLYQFYNTEFKDETNALLKKNKQALTKERIPSITQLFTPEWIVKYMVENSLGRIWIEGHPDNRLKSNWKYYLDEAEQAPEIEEQLKEIRMEYMGLKPEDLSLIDPCMGSGHILTYAFDVLMQIYEASGYTTRDAVKLIIENNLYGLDIDDRAYQLAYFSIMMKARQYDRGVFRRGYAPKVYAIEESNGITEEQIRFFGSELDDIERNNAIIQMTELLDTFKDARELGSIIKPTAMDWDLLHRFLDSFDNLGSLEAMAIDFGELQNKLYTVVNTAELLSRKYWVTCTNPPYMVPTTPQRRIIDKYYKNEKIDMGVVFITRLGELTLERGLQAMITMHSWMFLSTFDEFRNQFLKKMIINMAHLGTRAFDEIGGQVVQTTTFVQAKYLINGYVGTYSRLVSFKNETEKKEHLKKRDSLFFVNQNKYMLLPGAPILYWASQNFVDNYSQRKIKDYAEVITGMTIGDNKKYLRLWHEVNWETVFNGDDNIDNFVSPLKWIPYSKGGARRNWYGNYDYVVNWTQRNNFNRAKTTLQHLYLREAISWPFITTGMFSARILPKGSLWDVAGSPCFFNNKDDEYYALGMLCSKIANHILATVNPTINVQAIDIANIPMIVNDEEMPAINNIVEECVKNSRSDWDAFETSWDFDRHPLIDAIAHNRPGFVDVSNIDIAECYTLWESECEERFQRVKENEEELNRIFIDIYGLKDELTPEVADEEVTVRKADLKRDIKSFISYAVGCMLGRYSLDVEGLAYAGGEWDDSKYSAFIPDDDNCIPITDEDYFPDDIVGRFVEFVRVVYGDETLEKNLKFIADALSGNGEPRDVIRRYFLNDFFKDHCQTYSVTGSGKRPIYWLFDSGKQNGFKALVYMHRWNSDTIATVRARYVTKVQEKYENELRAIDLQLEHLSDPRQKAALQKRKEHIEKQVVEIKDYDEIISHVALDHIDIDLDDGVKVNHEKVQHDRSGKKYGILAPIK